MKKILLISTLIISFFSFSQNETEELVIDGNGKIISKTKITDSLKRGEIITPEKTIELFYKNQNNIKAIDPLLSFRFYQKTNYTEFKKMLEEKNKTCGEFIEKTFIKSQTSDDNYVIAFIYKVKYKNIETIEEIGLLRESENDDYQIFTYKIKRN